MIPLPPGAQETIDMVQNLACAGSAAIVSIFALPYLGFQIAKGLDRIINPKTNSDGH